MAALSPRTTRTSSRALTVVIALLCVSNACKDNGAVAEKPPKADSEPPSADALQIPTAEVQRLEVTRPGRPTMVFEREDERWQIRDPLLYPAHAELVESMAAVLGEIEIIERVADVAIGTHQLGDESGILVRAQSDKRSVAFTVGASIKDRTFVRRDGDETVYAIRGRCRRVFDLALPTLRDPVITNVELDSIEGVEFVNHYGRLALVPSRDKSGVFVEETPRLKDFYTERATKSVRVLSKLRAKAFVDGPATRESTGLFDAATARAELRLRGQEKALTVYVGKRKKGNLLHLRTSVSEQVFLVSGHFLSTLVPDPKKLVRPGERTQHAKTGLPAPRDEHRHAEEHSRNEQPDDEHGSAEHRHVHGDENPKQVPPVLLRSLRTLANSQRGATRALPAD